MKRILSWFLGVFASILMIFGICSFIFAENNNQNNIQESINQAENAQKLFDQNKFSEALVCAQNSITLDPKNNGGYFWSGMASRSLNMYDNAINYFKSSLKIANDINGNYFLGLCYIENAADNSNIINGIEYLSNALIINPDFAPALDRIGRSYLFGLKDTEKALPYLEKNAKVDENEYSLYHLGVAYSRLSNFQEAMMCFKKAKSIIEKNKLEDKWIIDNVNWAIDKTNKKVPLFF